MIMQYLGDEGYNASRMTMQDESNVKWHEREENTNDTRRLKKAILGKHISFEKTTLLLPVWTTKLPRFSDRKVALNSNNSIDAIYD
jgi:hypothetical protein